MSIVSDLPGITMDSNTPSSALNNMNDTKKLSPSHLEPDIPLQSLNASSETSSGSATATQSIDPSPLVSSAPIPTERPNMKQPNKEKIENEKESKKGKEKDKEKEKEKEITVPYFQLFRYADAIDIFLMIIGVLGAIAYGIIMPVISILLGDIIQPFSVYEYIRNIGFGGPGLDTAKSDLDKNAISTVSTFALVGLGALVACYIMQSAWMVAGERQAKKARTKFIHSALSQDLSWFDQNKPGDLTTRLTSDIILFQNGISEKNALAIAYVVQFFTGFIIAFVKSWKLTLVLLATIPLFALSGGIVGKVFAEGTNKSQAAYAKAGAIAQETLLNIRTVAAFGGQSKAFQKFSAALQETVKVNQKKAWTSGAGFGIFFGLLYGLFALGFWYGSVLTYNGEINVGQVLNVLFAITVGAFSIINMGPSIQSIAKGKGAASKLFRVIDNVPTIQDGVKEPTGIKGEIEFDNVSFNYPARPDVPILKNYSLKIEAGKTVALVGLSGSGKSTIIQLVERFYDVQGGQVKIDGVPIKELKLKWLRQNVGLVSQEPILFDASIEENVKYGAPDNLQVTKEMIEAACKMSNAHDFIANLPNGYKTLVGERGSLLSGGQKQRIAIARALIKNPKILLLDEATSALDTESERIVQDALDKASNGRTTIVVAHRLSTIKNADLIVVMKKGTILEQGKHDELISRQGAYAELVRAQELKTKQSHGKEGATLEDDLEEEEDDEDEEAEKDKMEDAQETKNEVRSITASQKSLNRSGNKRGSLVGSVDLVDEIEKERKKLEEEKKYVKEHPVSFTRVLKLQSPEWPILLVGVTMGTLNGLLLPAFGIILGEVLGVFSKPKEDMKKGAEIYAFVFIGLMVGNFVINLFQFGCFGIVGEALTKRVRETQFMALLRQEMAYFDDESHGTGTLTSQLSEQADQIQGLTGPNAANFLQLVASMVSALAIAFYFSWRMTLVVLACVPVLALGSFFEAQIFTGSTGRTRLAYAAASQTACDALQNIATVKSVNREATFANDYLKKAEAPYKAGLKKALLGSLGFGYSQAVQFWVYALAFYAGYRFVLDNVLTSSDMFKTIFTILFGSIAFAQAATFGPDLQKAKLAAIRYFEIIDRVPPIDISNKDGLTPVDVAGNVTMKDGHFAYPQRLEAPILKGVSLEGKSGQYIALVGPSGSGKSTVISLLLRFYDLIQGELNVDEYEIKKWQLEYLRKQMAIVSQEPSLFQGSIRENICYSREGLVPDDEVYKVAKMANIHDFIMQLPNGYETLITNSQLSGGQKQRICIGRALLRNPKLLLLDEATSALDSESEKAVQKALDEASKGRTTIAIAHRLSTIQNADLIIVVKQGVIVESGKHLELLEKNGLYSKLAKKQALQPNA